MTHCEDSSIISANLKSFRERYGDDPDVNTTLPSATKKLVSVLRNWPSNWHGKPVRDSMWPMSAPHVNSLFSAGIRCGMKPRDA